ncbi:MAG: hypothetical protein K2O06_10865 [Acetatifactor sp.]|nr:hypothetical protein [Acetatifactor sp.]
MKRGMIKLLAFCAVFILALIVIGRIMNRGHDNLTIEMAPASLPLLSMEMDGIIYNQLHGYTRSMDTAFQRDTVTVLGEGRDTGFVVDTYGCSVTGISAEVRSADGTRLVENLEITDYRTQRGQIRGKIALKDLLDKDTDYSLSFILKLDEGTEVYYYTRIIWGDSLFAKEKLEYVIDFHERLYDREAARELIKYLETDSRLEDNSSFHKVNIHSSFRQITWGELNVEEIAGPWIRMTEAASQTASFLMDYVVAVSGENGQTRYLVQEHYRVRYTTERMYLLDYERTMTQIPDQENMCANDKLLLGITGTDVPMMENEDGSVVVFQAANRLLSYDVTENRLAVIFSFYDTDSLDPRVIYDQHSIKILDVDEGGNVQFALYGYMNRGRHEGEVGISLYTFDSRRNTVEELVYIPYDRTYSVLAAELDRLLYLNRDRKLYLQLNDMVYVVDIAGKTWAGLINITHDGALQVSDDHKIAVWPEGNDTYRSQVLNIRNLSSDVLNKVNVGEGEAVMPLGFMDEDIIYGVARLEDIVRENSGRTFFPMYRICICDPAGKLMKEYRQPGIYVTGCTVENNQIALERLTRTEAGEYAETYSDHIMNNTEQDTAKNFVVAADIDVYERYVQIQTKSEIDQKSIKIVTPKEVVFEDGRELKFPDGQESARYYVYGPYGVNGIFFSPARAVNLAYDMAGVVVDHTGERIWMRGNRHTRNQIMAIKEVSASEEKSSVAACLDTIFQYEGLVRNSEYLLAQGQSVREILENNLEGAQILDMAGCNLDSVLYYVDRDIPVMALLENGEAVLITGYNELNLLILEPSADPAMYRKGINDSSQWFEENGNCFITYVKNK